MSDVLLEQVGPSGRAVLEELERVVRADVLADHDDADLGMALSQVHGGLDALVGVGRGHPDVGDHDVRAVQLDSPQERTEVGAVLEDLDLFSLPLERAADPLADEVGVLGDDETVERSAA